MPAPAEGRLAVIIGESDVTVMFDKVGDELVLRPMPRVLPAGESELVVYLVTPANEWQPISRIPVKVLSPRGYEVATATPRLAITNKGQLGAGQDGSAPAPARGEYQDFAGTAGLQTSHERSAWALQSQTNVVAASNIREALRFGELQDSAPKADLSDYLVTLQRGGLNLSMGHVSYGAQRHLIDGFASRGVDVDVRLGMVRVGLAALNGSSIVGWSNPLGVASADHRILSGTLGLELIPSQPGRLAIDATVLDGSVLPRAGYTQGVVNDAEKGRGVGVRLRASDPGQRVSLEARIRAEPIRQPSRTRPWRRVRPWSRSPPWCETRATSRWASMCSGTQRSPGRFKRTLPPPGGTSGSIRCIEASPLRAAPICSRTRSASPVRWAASRSRLLTAARTTTWPHFRRC